MVEEKMKKGPEKCQNCSSIRLFEQRYFGSGVEVSAFSIAKQQAFICVDCGFTMLFTREKHKDRILKEFMKQQ